MTLPGDYFDDLYASNADPWGFAERWYEKRKYALTLACLPQERYGSAYEPACSIGVLTASLAARCDRLLSCDGSAVAVAQARARTSDLPHVRIEQSRLPEEWTTGPYDLVILSEFLYYLSDEDLVRVIELAVASVAPGGTLVATHWRHPVDDYPRTGDFVHAALAERAAAAGLVQFSGYLEEDFRIDAYTRPAASGPA